MPDITVSIKPSFKVLANKFGNIKVAQFLGDKIKELAFMVEREAKKVSPHYTGRMRASIRVMGNIQPLQEIIQPNVDYAIYVHEGTRYMKKRPFMYWGAQTASKDFEGKFSKDLESFIQKGIK